MTIVKGTRFNELGGLFDPTIPLEKKADLLDKGFTWNSVKYDSTSLRPSFLHSKMLYDKKDVTEQLVALFELNPELRQFLPKLEEDVLWD